MAENEICPRCHSRLRADTGDCGCGYAPPKAPLSAHSEAGECLYGRCLMEADGYKKGYCRWHTMALVEKLADGKVVLEQLWDRDDFFRVFLPRTRNSPQGNDQWNRLTPEETWERVNGK